MFLVENDGYTIERLVHTTEATYNDIPQWRYDKFPEAFIPEKKAASKRVRVWKISTKDELENLLGDQSFADGQGLQVRNHHMRQLVIHLKFLTISSLSRCTCLRLTRQRRYESLPPGLPKMPLSR